MRWSGPFDKLRAPSPSTMLGILSLPNGPAEGLDLKTLERVGVNALHPHLLNVAHPCGYSIF